MKFKMVHENYNVADLAKSMAFYEKALGLTEKSRINGDGFIIVYLGNETTDFELELTQLEEHPQPYNLGECEFHLAFEAEDFDAAHKLHEEMGCICFENHDMGIYFINEPDGYWLEVVPAKKQPKNKITDIGTNYSVPISVIFNLLNFPIVPNSP